MSSLLLIAALSITPVDRPEHAVSYALGDLVANVPEDHRWRIRYLWVPPEEAETENIYPISCYAIHQSATHAQAPVNPALVAGGRLLRLDAVLLDPHSPHNFLRTFDGLAKQDGTFHSLANVFVTFYQQLPVGSAVEVYLNSGRWKPATFQGMDGQRIRFRVQGGKVTSTIVRYVRPRAVHAGHLGTETLRQLCLQTRSECPVLDVRFFMWKGLTTIDGGQYYQFRRTPRGKGNQSDFDALAAKLGIKSTLAEMAKTSSRSGIGWSGVSGGPRSVLYLNANVERPASGASLFRFTLDVDKDNVREDQDPTVSLIDPEYDAGEAIYPLPWGGNGFALYNGDGDLQDEVPNRIAFDDHIPTRIDGKAIAESRLNSGMSCIRCHGDADGVQPAPNLTLKKINAGFTLLSDKSLAKLGYTQTQAQDILLSMYGADLTKPAQRARDDYTEAVFGLTGMEVAEVSAGLSKVFSRYVWAPVTPRRALLDCGWDVPDADSVWVLQALVGNLPSTLGDRLESQRLTDLLVGDPVQRRVWMRLQNETIMRVKRWEESYETREAAAEAMRRLIDQAKRRGNFR